MEWLPDHLHAQGRRHARGNLGNGGSVLGLDLIRRDLRELVGRHAGLARPVDLGGAQDDLLGSLDHEGDLARRDRRTVGGVLRGRGEHFIRAGHGSWQGGCQHRGGGHLCGERCARAAEQGPSFQDLQVKPRGRRATTRVPTPEVRQHATSLPPSYGDRNRRRSSSRDARLMSSEANRNCVNGAVFQPIRSDIPERRCALLGNRRRQDVRDAQPGQKTTPPGSLPRPRRYSWPSPDSHGNIPRGGRMPQADLAKVPAPPWSRAIRQPAAPTVSRTFAFAASRIRAKWRPARPRWRIAPQGPSPWP